jgi:hypothetical protein
LVSHFSKHFSQQMLGKENSWDPLLKNDIPFKLNVINIRNNLSTFVYSVAIRKRIKECRYDGNDSTKKHLNCNENL